MKIWHQLMWIALVSLAAAGGTYFAKGPPVRVLTCDPSSLKADELCLESIPTDKDVLWVDGRARADWLKNGVAGSVLWNLDPNEDMQAFEAEVAARIAATPFVIVYCGDENCGVSRQVAERIRALDLSEQVYVLFGGWRALKDAGRVNAK